jgi:hypothetical protein
VDGFGGGDGRLAPLAGAVENSIAGGGLEDFDLARIGIELEESAGESDGVIVGEG